MQLGSKNVFKMNVFYISRPGSRKWTRPRILCSTKLVSNNCDNFFSCVTWKYLLHETTQFYSVRSTNKRNIVWGISLKRLTCMYVAKTIYSEAYKTNHQFPFNFFSISAIGFSTKNTFFQNSNIWRILVNINLSMTQFWISVTSVSFISRIKLF